MATFPVVLNNVSTFLRATHAVGDGLIRVMTGAGAAFGNNFPLRITCQRLYDGRVGASDTFTDVNGTDLTTHKMDFGPGWSRVDAGGIVQVQGNQAQVIQVDAGTSRAGYVVETGQSDTTIQVSVTTMSGGSAGSAEAGLVFRYQDPTHFWALTGYMGDGKYYLYLASGGAGQPVASWAAGVTYGVQYVMKVIAIGNTFQVFKDNTLVGTYTDATYNTATKHGIRSWTASYITKFDNFSVSGKLPNSPIGACVIYYVNSRNGDDLSVSGAIEGTTDIPLAQGDMCQMRTTAGTVTDIQSNLLYTTSTPTNLTVGGIPAGSTFNNVLLPQVVDQLLHGPPAPPSGGGPVGPWYPMGLPQILNALAGNANYYQWYGGFCAGISSYLIPFANGYFLQINPVDFASIVALNLQALNSDWYGFGGGFSDGRYAYLMGMTNAEVVRVDLQTFPNTANVTMISLVNIDPINYDFWTLFYGATDGLYGYTPSNSNAKLGRFSLSNFDPSSGAMVDLQPIQPNPSIASWVEADDTTAYVLWQGMTTADVWLTATSNTNFTLSGTRMLSLIPWGKTYQSFQLIGDYIYAIPYVSIPDGNTASGLILKINKRDFTDVKTLDVGALNSKYQGFYGGFTDSYGRFLYLAPRVSTVAVRIDLNDFQSVDAVDLLPFGINGACHGAFSDGRFGYIVQYDDPANPPYNRAGRIARFQLYNGGHI